MGQELVELSINRLLPVRMFTG